MIITAFIHGQQLTLSRAKIVAGSNDYQEMQVILQTGDWAGLALWAHFTQDGKNIYDIEVRDCRITRDQHLNLSAGTWQVYFTGLDLDSTMRITTDVQTLTVQATGAVCGGFPEVPQTHAEQVTRDAAEARRLAQGVRDDADAGEFDGGYYKITVTAEGQELVLRYTASEPGMAEIPDQRVKLEVPGVSPEDVAKAVADYLEKNPVQAPVQSVNGKTGVVTLVAADVQAVGLEQLPEAINTALAQAQASGAFKGDKGDPGRDGAPGKDGKDGKDGKPGPQGEPGKDGSPGQPGANGTEGADGGYYTPTVSQPDPNEILMEFLPSKPEMPVPEPATIILPEASSDLSLGVTGAQVGQIVEVQEIGPDGKPTKWRAVDKPSGGGGETLIASEELLSEGVIDPGTYNEKQVSLGIDMETWRKWKTVAVEIGTLEDFSVRLYASRTTQYSDALLREFVNNNRLSAALTFIDTTKNVVKVEEVVGRGWNSQFRIAEYDMTEEFQAARVVPTFVKLRSGANGLGINVVGTLSKPVTWRVKGLIKYGV